MDKIVYKLVGVYNGILTSWNTSLRPRPDEYIEYVPNELITAPDKSKIFVFDSPERALEFLKGLGIYGIRSREQLWEAEGFNVSRPKFMMVGGFVGIKRFEVFWKARASKKALSSLPYRADVPKGTLFADSVRLSRRIQ